MSEITKNAATVRCPGRNDHFIQDAVITALKTLPLELQKVVWVSDAGQTTQRLRSLGINVFNSLYGQTLPVAAGLKLANPSLTVLTECGGEGSGRFMLSSLERTLNLTVLIRSSDNLTVNQGRTLKGQPFYPLAAAIALGAGLVARGFSGHGDQLAGLMAEAIRYPGPALVSILGSGCESFSPADTFTWYSQRVKPVGRDHDPADLEAALLKSLVWGEEIPTGILYRRAPAQAQPGEAEAGKKGGVSGPVSLVDAPPDRLKLAGLMGANLY